MNKNQLAVKGHKALIQNEGMKGAIMEALPSKLALERFCRSVTSAITKNPKLGATTQQSFANAVLDLAILGLMPGRTAHLIPYKDQCTLIIDYKGYVELLWKSESIKRIHADVVTVQEVNLGKFLFNKGRVEKHEPVILNREKDIAGAYAEVILKSGEEMATWMSTEDIEAIRQSSQGRNAIPWKEHWGEMAKKTALRRLMKLLDLTPELDKAQEIEDEEPANRNIPGLGQDQSFDFSTPAQEKPNAKTEKQAEPAE